MISKFYFTEECSQKIRDTINNYDGGEIFFGCYIEEDGAIYDVDPICYGNEEAVLAPFELAEKYNAILHNHPSGVVHPSINDMQYANFLKNQGIGFFITDNQAKKLSVVMVPVIVKKSNKISNEEIDEIFGKNGKISQFKKDYEVRSGQVLMSKDVVDGINNNKVVVIEAGTGIGKSLAYLFPAFLYVMKTGQRVVISTNTINLQNQLLNKDIPFVSKVLDTDIKAVLVKGRRNYVCLLKLSNLESEFEFSDEEKQINNILEWVNSTKDGTIDDLSFVPSNSVWEKVASDSDFCRGPKCIHYNECFLQIARRKMSEANILVANHHILFADIQLKSLSANGTNENSLLPPYKKIIFDEAHNIERAASTYFSNSFSKTYFYKFISLYRGKKNNFFKKFANRLILDKNKKIYAIGEYIEREVIQKIDILYNESFDIFSECNEYLLEILEENNDSFNEKVSFTKRLKASDWESQNFINYIKKPLFKLSELINDLIEVMKNCEIMLNEINDSKYEVDAKIFSGYISKIQTFYKALIELLDSRINNNTVAWIEIFGENPESLLFNIVVCPLYLNDFFQNSLYKLFETVVFASATLTVNDSFDFFKSLTGLNFLEEKEVIYSKYESPFNYKDNVLFVVPTDIPNPDSFEYNDKLNDFIYNCILATKGSTFVLFTSYSQLNRSFEFVNPLLREKGYRSFKQGEKNKEALLKDFIEEKDSNLFATDSFWEGVDAPGETLRNVILTKLPFKMPTEPLEQARVEDLKNRGLDSFILYTVPQAVIKFKQGFGRLVRTKDDYGIVCLLDSRSVTKPYGKIFFKSLPRCQFFSGESVEIYKKIEEHIKKFEK